MKNGRNDNYIMDGLRVQQILLNVLYNAVKFTPEGGKVTMTSQVEKEEDIAIITFVIEDTGIGMSKEFVENRLFHSFEQENENITSPYAGCGNGLVICKRLAKLMDGDITCVSEQGKGTIFTITLKAEWIKTERRRRERKPVPSYDLSGTKVLMCEDNPMNQDMERRLLEHMKCTVDIADDGQIGLDKFMASEIGYYDIVLMDIRMPNMDGIEATRKIRGLERTDALTVPIVAISANAFEEDIRMSLEAGMNEHLAKPVDAKILYEKIKEYVIK